MLYLLPILIAIIFAFCLLFLFNYFPGIPHSVEECKKDICAYYTANECKKTEVNDDDFKQKRGKTYKDIYGVSGYFPCSSQYLGFHSIHDHERHLMELKRRRLIALATVAVSSFALILSLYSTINSYYQKGALKQLLDRVEVLEHIFIWF